MKKTLSIILASVMIISSMIALAVPAAAEQLGVWDVLLSEADNDKEYNKKPPLPGYYYDEKGFHTVSPNYRDYNPKFTVISSEQYDIRNFSMTVVIHDYRAYGDNWISFSVWSDYNGMNQGDTSGKYGDGWTSLIRSFGSEEINRFESWNQTKGSRTGTQIFRALDDTQLNPVIFPEVINEDGDKVITFAITDGVVTVNGTAIGTATDKCIADRFKDGYAYVAVTLHNTDQSGDYYPTISVTDVNGEVPCGSDSRKPSDRIIGGGCHGHPPASPPDPPVNEPAIWFDATLEGTNYQLPTVSGCQISWADNNLNFLITPESSSFYIDFNVPDHIIYQASDYSTIAIIFKNQLFREGGETLLWYLAGENTSPRGSCVTEISEYMDVTSVDAECNYTTPDRYTLALIDLSDKEWEGRIHGFRLDVSGYDGNEFEILGIGAFRSAEEALVFTSRLQDLGFNTENLYPEVKCDHIDYDKDGICDICVEEIAKVPEDTTGDTSENTTEVITQDASTERQTEERSESTIGVFQIDLSGCTITASFGMIGIVSLIGAAMAIKKKED